MNAERKVTPDGLEATFATNYLAPFLLTHLLLDVVQASAPARIINVSAAARKIGKIDFADLQGARHYNALKAYAQSKLAQVCFTYELAERLKGTGVTVNALDPGHVVTHFNDSTKGLLHVIADSLCSCCALYDLCALRCLHGPVRQGRLGTSHSDRKMLYEVIK